jgi:hypothetical protein
VFTLRCSNFINTFFDTPDGNLPWPASWQAVEILFGVLEALDADIVARVMGDALNMRLGTTNLSMVQASNLGATRGMSLGDLVALPEQDSYVYSDGLSMVCDSYLCAIAKAAGLFGDLADEIQCTEFDNFDAYSLAGFWNLTRTRPAECVAADPDVPYCQIMGYYVLPLPKVNTVEPYAHMAEKCSALPMDYTRPPMC